MATPKTSDPVADVTDEAPTDDGARVITVHGAPQVDGSDRAYTTYVTLAQPKR